MTGLRPLARNDVVLLSFPFTDLSGTRVRPGLVVGRVSGHDLIVAFITSRVGSTNGRDALAEHSLNPSAPEFPATGLKTDSIIRLDKLATLSRRLVRRRIGRVGEGTAAAVGRCLRYVFEF